MTDPHLEQPPGRAKGKDPGMAVIATASLFALLAACAIAGMWH